MEVNGTAAGAVRFRAFRFDLRTHELNQNGYRIRLRGHPIKVLTLLLEHPGELVTREALQERLWPDGTIVDFEHILNNSINRLRHALGDKVDAPVFIETVPGQGYRFICPVERAGEAESKPQPGVPETGPAPAVPIPAMLPELRPRGWRWATAGVVMLAACIASGIWYLSRPISQLRIIDYTQLTNDGRKKRIAGTDGSRLYLVLLQPGGNAVAPLTGGRPANLTVDLPSSGESQSSAPFIVAVSPDGSKLLAGINWDPTSGHQLWVVGTYGSTARYLTNGDGAAWSPDNKTVAYTNPKGDIYIIPSEGGESRLLLASPGDAVQTHMGHSLAWSPDGSRIRFTREGRYWEVSVDGTNAHELLPDWHSANPRTTMLGGQWAPDGGSFLFAARNHGSYFDPILSRNLGTQIWTLDEHRSWFRRRHANPVQLTSGATSWGGDGFAVSKDGTKIYATGTSSRGELVVYDPKSNALKPFLGGISAEFVDFSADGRYVVYVAYPDGVMWRANRDGTGLTQLTNQPFYPMNPRWSPDGTQIVFFNSFDSELHAIYVMPSQGGTPKLLLSRDTKFQTDPGWSPDGKKIVFAESDGADPVGTAVRILELASGKITGLPRGPMNFFSPRWSPNGRYILGMTWAHPALALFDLQTKRWSQINLRNGMQCNYPAWSYDGRFIYFLNIDWAIFKSSHPGVYRVSVHGGEPEKVVDLSDFTPAESSGAWMGLDRDDNPLLLRDAGTREIYALTLGRR